MQGVQRGRGLLTTPHGDQEPGIDDAVHSAKHLTTPHGDQEQSDDAWSVDVGVVPPSLPLMGIRNGEHSRLPARRPNLTTPHGDQEPVIILDRFGDTKPSLPLMGIRNCRTIWASSSRQRLTTPHGDQEQFLRLHFELVHRRLTTPHGDQERTTPARCTSLYELLLTTPHGDQEPAPA